ncbi:hypothetical protein [Deinococcus aquaticus]|uniref:Outer membrane protein beta-barrel domain-containing protein n=1 Tax=Deinococcus aquaticus TaxID=328692 RepID=A0ABY7UXZ2_9DEIO|nr:hypothetical protein [Deinococcus aquaticus]WDA57777.1 hypothetical protein M8445_10485 [Deinococcus aquaticus]
MKNLIPLTILAIAASTATAGAQSLSGVELGLTGGYAGGLSGEAFVHAPNVIGPVGVKAGVAVTRSADAINDSSKDALGTTFADRKKNDGFTESGSQTVVSLDGTYSLGEVAPGVDTTLYAGGRYGMFRATETANSTSSNVYSSNSFGIGAGVMASYALSGNISLVGDLGVDHFFKNTINVDSTNAGNTTTYNYPTSDADYAYNDSRFVRPGTNFKARVGIKATF